MRFVIDEDMPRSLGPALRAAGHEVLDIRDHGLRGAGDSRIFQFAVEKAGVLITEDLGFANLLHFPTGSHSGIIVSRLPSTLSTPAVVTAVTGAVGDVGPNDFTGALIIVEPGRIRIRRRRP